jgi:hypothetical protein
MFAGELSQINNPQQSWGFEWEPPKAVMKDSGARDWTLWGGSFSCSLSAISGVLETKYFLAQSLLPRELRALRAPHSAQSRSSFSLPDIRSPLPPSSDGCDPVKLRFT